MKLNRFIGSKAFYRKLFAIMLPILVQNVITNFVSLLDNIMVGQVGTEPMSGVAIVNQLIFVFNLCIFGGLAGAGIFTAQYYGKNDSKGVADTFRAKLYIAAFTSAAFIVVFLLFGEQLIMQFIHEGEEQLDMAATLNYGKDYLAVMLIQIPPFALQQVYASTLKESGETLVPMKAGIIAVLVNLVGNYILIFGKLGAPVMGVVGAAIATVISRFVECAIIIIWTHRHRDTNPFVDHAYTTWRIPETLLRQIVVMGLPLLVNELLWSSGMTVLSQCYSMRGLEVVSAVNISTTVSNLFFCAFFSMGNSIAIIIGLPLGVVLWVTDKDGLHPNKGVNTVLGFIVNFFRSIPAVILMVAMIPAARLLLGTSTGNGAVIVTLIIAAAPYVARMVESSLKEVPAGVIEAAQAMGCTNLQIIWHVLLPEAKPSLISGSIISTVTILSYTALAATLGGTGLGQVAIIYGHQRSNDDITWICVLLTVVIVQIIQIVGTYIARKTDKRIK